LPYPSCRNTTAVGVNLGMYRAKATLSAADPGVGRSSGCADDRTQNIQFGMARADRLGDQVAEHIGGDARARWRGLLATLGDDPDLLSWTAYHSAVSQAHQEPGPMADRLVTIEDLARAQHAEPVADPADLAADIWESDEEFEAFLADLRAARNASLA